MPTHTPHLPSTDPDLAPTPPAYAPRPDVVDETSDHQTQVDTRPTHRGPGVGVVDETSDYQTVIEGIICLTAAAAQRDGPPPDGDAGLHPGNGPHRRW